MIMLHSENDVAETVKATKGPLHIRGGGTRPIGRVVAGDALSVAGLSGITLYEPGALTLVAQAGTPIAEIEAALTAENQRLAFEPMDHRTVLGTSGAPTIGGVVAANVSGPRRISVGACRDFLLGVRYVNGMGEVVKNGGRVMKNVTGYDLVKLMAGSYGTLGVLTEVSLKVLPNVETAATLRFVGLDVSQSVALMSDALGSPYEITGAARTGSDTMLRIEGFAGSVAYRTQALLKKFGDAEVITDPAKHATLWQDIRDAKALAAHGSIWRVSLRPSQTPHFLSQLQGKHSFDHALDWGGSLIWIAAKSDADVAGLHAALQQDAALRGGHATLIKAAPDFRQTVPSFQPEAPAVAAITAGIRSRFDPRGILNAGLMT
jgi:glycolate oxidase FAD binding subunit